MSRILSTAVVFLAFSSLHANEPSQRGLMVKSYPVSSETLKQLAYMGIQYTFHIPFCPTTQAISPPHLDEEIAPLADFQKKSKVFRKWFEKYSLRPSKLVMVKQNHMGPSFPPPAP